MAKKTQAAGDTRQKLIEDAKAKVAEAAEALDAAKKEFAAAETDPARAEAQVKINAASEQAERFSGALDALLKAEKPAAGADHEADGPTTRDFIVGGNGTIRHNGRDFDEGETIALTKPEFEQLAPLGVLAGEA